MLRAIDRMRAEDRMVYATLIDAAARNAAHEDRKTREALFELASYVASDQGTRQ